MKDEQKSSLRNLHPRTVDLLRGLASHRYDKDSEEKIKSLLNDIRHGNLKFSPAKSLSINDAFKITKRKLDSGEWEIVEGDIIRPKKP